jgi:hypothetical protein
MSHHHHHKHPSEQEGLCGTSECVGRGSLGIRLQREPKLVEVFFTGEGTSVPCNPNQDTLTWKVRKDVVRRQTVITLSIEWSVAAGEQEIEWIVWY